MGKERLKTTNNMSLYPQYESKKPKRFIIEPVQIIRVGDVMPPYEYPFIGVNHISQLPVRSQFVRRDGDKWELEEITAVEYNMYAITKPVGCFHVKQLHNGPTY